MRTGGRWGRLENMLVAAEVYGEINKKPCMSPFNKINNNCKIIYVVMYFIFQCTLYM